VVSISRRHAEIKGRRRGGARRLSRVTKAGKDLTDRQHAYMRATFLLVPGAAEAYDGLIRRLEASR